MNTTVISKSLEAAVKYYNKKYEDDPHFKYRERKYLDDSTAYRSEEKVNIEFNKLSRETIDFFRKDNCEVMQKRLLKFDNLIKGASSKECKTLSTMPTMLNEYYRKKTKKGLVFIPNKNDVELPYVISSCTYHQPRSEYPAYVTLNLRYRKSKSNESTSFRFYRDDLGATIPEILSKKKIFIYDDNHEIVKKYHDNHKVWLNVNEDYYSEYIATGHAYDSEGKYRTQILYYQKNQRVLIENINEAPEIRFDEDLSYTTYSESLDKDVRIPDHLFVTTFDFQKHMHVDYYIESLKKYVYDPKVIDKLVLDQEVIELIHMLVDTEGDLMEDIISGKTGGKIIAATGPPGVGKTLTAECFSEIIERPIYRVQCSQLGLKIDEIEKKLEEVLERAGRWKAILLIDEADVYVRTRGVDIHQNAIVGVFLRVLEYYQGVLFFTSNLGDQIDDAIMSRTSAHFVYKLPTPDQREKILKIICDINGLKPDKKAIEFIRKNNLSGRDIKECTKFAGMVSAKRKEKLSEKHFKLAVSYKNTNIKNNSKHE